MTTGAAESSTTGRTPSLAEATEATSVGGNGSAAASALSAASREPSALPAPALPRELLTARTALPETSLISAELTVTILQAAAGLALLAGIAIGLQRLAEVAGDETGELGVGALLAVLAGPAVGAVSAAGLLGLAGLLELLLAQAALLRRLSRTLEERGPRAEPVKPTEDPVPDLLEQVIDSLGELRDVLLMDEAERRAHSRAIIDIEQRRRLEEIQSHVQSGNAAAALKAIALFEVRFPTSPEPARLRLALSEAKQQRRLEEANRLADAAEQAARAERWREAFLLSSDLIAKYADTPPADFARSGLDTLRRNAEIETRREWEERLRELMNAQRWADAVSVAERLVSLYPDSPQAGLLREKLPQLRQQAGL